MILVETTIKHSDIENLERLFATLTPDGWHMPEWLIVLREAADDRLSAIDLDWEQYGGGGHYHPDYAHPWNLYR